MYKKIKNGSFMNWIWFIICIMPILLLTIYSLQFFNNKSSGYKQTNLINLQNDYVGIDVDTQKYYVNNYFEYWSGYGVPEFVTNTINYKYDGQNYTTDVFILYPINSSYNGVKYYAYIELINLQNENDMNIVYQINGGSNISTLVPNEIINLNGILDDTTDNLNIHLDISNNIPDVFYYEFSLKIFITFEQPIDTINVIDNWFYMIIDSSYYDYVGDLLNTIQTNGFISNAFLNLSQFFGVNNIYYSLACYYIEYLLVIILLHLAFDVLYILPNICHKFMERIGGERD